MLGAQWVAGRGDPVLAAAVCASSTIAAETAAPYAVPGRVIIDRTTAAWESQQVQEPCILPNPKNPAQLVMFYSGVPASNRRLCYIGKAWALRSDPFTWHQDAGNPIFSPSADGWDSGSLRLDCVLYVPEGDAYYIYYSGTNGGTQDHIGLAICPAGADGYAVNIVNVADVAALGALDVEDENGRIE